MTEKQAQKPQTANASVRRDSVDTAWKVGYRLTAYIGALVVYWLKWAVLVFRVPGAAVGRAAAALWHAVAVRPWRAVLAEGRHIRSGFTAARERLSRARRRGWLLAVLQAAVLPFMAVRRHKKVLAGVCNVVMPLAAAALLAVTVRYWSNVSFGLTLEYDGESLGYISDESVFDTAVAMVNERVRDTGEATLQVRTPKMTLAVLSDAQVLDETSVCDKIIQLSGDEFAQATGIYVDGELMGSVTSADEAAALLDERLAVYRTADSTAEFVQNVTTLDGLFPLSTIRGGEDMAALLDSEKEGARYYTVQAGDSPSRIASNQGVALSQLLQWNGLSETDSIHVGDQLLVGTAVKRLQVRTVSQATAEEDVAYTTVTEKDDTAYEGTRKVTVKGQNGSRLVTRQTVCVDGQVVSVTEISSVTTKEPVQEVVKIGTKKRSTSSAYTNGVTITEGDGVSTGSMLWPVPAVHNVYQKFHSGHAGIDVSGGKVTMLNTPIVAADGGRVIAVNTNPNVGYGIYVMIDHGNGIVTMYAHLKSVSVVNGQSVTRGQEIGRGGSTGWSTGPHLHFEVRVNGRCVDPLKYVSPY